MPDSFYVFVERKKKRKEKKSKKIPKLGGIKLRTFIPSAIWTVFKSNKIIYIKNCFLLA